MIRRHRKIHRLAWIALTPLLLAMILAYSNTGRDLYPVNDEADSAAVTDSGKGALP